MDRETTDTPCLDRLQLEAIACLSGFPAKVRALNDIISTYAPETATDNKSHHLSNSCSTDPSGQTVRSRRSKSEQRERISKRRFHRKRSFPKKDHRRRPGPLANILTALSHSLALCANTMVITPSRYIGNQVIATLRDTLNKRQRLIRLTCNLSTIWPTFGRKAPSVANAEVDSTVGNCIGIMRPAAAQLIADTTKLKRYLQALAVAQNQTPELIQAIRRTESIDGWAYELFFHLKYLQENQLLSSAERASTKFGTNDGPKPLNLWHRLVQLRDNYAYLYESLCNKDMRRLLGLPRSRTSGVT